MVADPPSSPLPPGFEQVFSSFPKFSPQSSDDSSSGRAAKHCPKVEHSCILKMYWQHLSLATPSRFLKGLRSQIGDLSSKAGPLERSSKTLLARITNLKSNRKKVFHMQSMKRGDMHVRPRATFRRTARVPFPCTVKRRANRANKTRHKQVLHTVYSIRIDGRQPRMKASLYSWRLLARSRCLSHILNFSLHLAMSNFLQHCGTACACPPICKASEIRHNRYATT